MNSLLKNIIIVTAFVVLAIIAALTAGSFEIINAGDSETCMSCHEDKDLAMEKNGKKISLFVDKEHYLKSVHGTADCEDCHLKYNAEEIPHTKTSQSVDCKSCHDDLEGLETSVHSSVNCIECHSKHDIKPVKELKSSNCMSCHKNKNVAAFSTSVHAKNNVSCDGCHESGHSAMKISRKNVVSLCGKCHSETKMKFKGSIHQTVLKDGVTDAPVCTDCHGAHKILTSKFSIESEGCLKCHLDENKFPGEERGSAKFVAKYKTSIHASIRKGEIEAAGCVDCHGNHMIQNPDDPKSSTSRALLMETCGKCHSDVVQNFRKSKHGQELLKNNEKAPTCITCHGEHDIKSVLLTDEFSKIKIADRCLECHKDGKIPHKNYKGEEELISGYKKSVHYEALQKGELRAPTCSDCHGAHEMEKADNPDSKISRKNIANTCGSSECHGDQYVKYRGSIHETGVSKGNNDAPACNNCHGNHGIITKQNADTLAKSRDLIQLCSNCHASVEMIERNDLPTKVSETYKESFHGLATRGGLKEAANCESCHGYHNVRPSNDSLSTINKKNLPQTCGKCHPGAEQILFTSKIHLEDTETDSPWVYWITRFYIFLIFSLIGYMTLHNLLDYRKKKIAVKENEK